MIVQSTSDADDGDAAQLSKMTGMYTGLLGGQITQHSVLLVSLKRYKAVP